MYTIRIQIVNINIFNSEYHILLLSIISTDTKLTYMNFSNQERKIMYTLEIL